MKRFFAFIIILNLIFCSLPVAAIGTVLSGSLETAIPGERVSVSLTLENNPGLAAWKIDLNWNETVLTLDKSSIRLSDSFSSGMFVSNSNSSGKLSLVWANVENVSANGNLITFSFIVADTAVPGDYPITISTSGTRSENGEKIKVAATDAIITLEEPYFEEPEENDPPKQEPAEDAPSKPSVIVPVQPTKPDEEVVPPVTIPDAETSTSTLLFTDVFSEDYYYQPVAWAVENQITNGVSENLFSPNATCSRVQTVTFLWRAAGCPLPTIAESKFVDVPRDSYYYNAVLWAVENGITNGTSATQFSPNAPVTRAQVVTFLWRNAGTLITSSQSVFNDVPFDSYYSTAVSWAVSHKITNGMTANTFAPDSGCSRGQIVTFLYRYFQNN